MTPDERTLLVATTNRGKLDELSSMLSALDYHVIGLSDLSEELGPAPAVVEDGATLLDNAILKAKAYAEFSGLPTIADDSGLVVDVLDGAPGVHSARYSGPDATDADNNAKLLTDMEGMVDRQAHFACALAFVPAPNQSPWTTYGRVDGQICDQAIGRNRLWGTTRSSSQTGTRKVLRNSARGSKTRSPTAPTRWQR